MIGSPVDASEWDLDGAFESGKKASGGGSAIPVGRVAFLTGSTGLWAIATAGSTGRMGVIPKVHPANVDGDTSVNVLTRPGGKTFVEAAGALKPGCQLLPTTGGKVISTSGQGFAVYKGHDGEGSLGSPPTDGANAEAVWIELSGDVI